MNVLEAGSEFTGYVKDRYTTLPETRDRILATAVTARWRHAGASGEWGESFAAARAELPNRHHFVGDLTPFGLANDNEVFRAEDRPYGLIEAVLSRPDAPPPGPAWDPYRLVR